MPLTGAQSEQLVAAIRASLDWEGLERLVQFKFDMKLSDAVAKGPFQQVAFDWVAWLEQRGWTADFIGFLWAERKDNPLVRQFYEAFTAASSFPPQVPPLVGVTPARTPPLPIPDEAREKVVEFRTLFRKSEEQFGYLNAFKDLHDTLHTLHDLEEGIVVAAARPGSAGLLVIADDLKVLAVEAQKAAGRLEFPEDDGWKWIAAFAAAADQLRSANPADVETAVKTLRELPDQHQAELDAELVRTLRRVKPNELAKTAADALTRLGAAGAATSPLLSEFRARMGGFSGLFDGLARLIEQHTTCQRVEVILAPFATAPEDLEAKRVPEWAVAAVALARLAAVRESDLRARNVAAAGVAFAAAAPPEASERFVTLLVRFRRLFQDVDKELLAATDDLVHEARLLGVQLRTLTNVPN